eukprot:scaffold312230_cov21-Tisochrysis_lutea.AAC.1
MQVGCGAGNTLYPLLEVNPELRVYACDFAPAAVQLVKEHPAYASGMPWKPDAQATCFSYLKTRGYV